LCRSLYCLCVYTYMCNVLLPPRGYPITVNKYINYNSVQLNLALVPDLVCIQHGRKGQYDALLRGGQISASQTAVKRQTV